MAENATSTVDGGRSLNRNAIGLVPTVFQSITTIAPAGGAASGLLLTTAYAGGSTPLTVVLALVGCLFVAIAIGQLARHLPSAGGLYTYNSHGLGNDVGYLVAWGLIGAYAFIPTLYWGFIGLICASEIANVAPGAPSWLWVPLGLIAAALIWFVLHRGVGFSTRTGVIAGALEMAVFIALSITLIVAAGGHNTLAVFAAHNHNAHGFGSLFAGMIFAILAFTGFEAAAPIAEETRDPKRNIPRAVLLSTVGVGLFYVLAYYAATVYFGPARMAKFSLFDGGNPWSGMAGHVWGLFAILVFLAVVNSFMACNNSSTNAASRMIFALGWIGMIPSGFARIHKRHGTPFVAIGTLIVATTAVAVFLGLTAGGPIAVLTIFGTALTIIFIPVYVLTAISSGVFYWRQHREEFNWLLHALVPLLAVAFFAPVEIASLGINFANLGISPVTGIAADGLWLALGWMVAGLLALGYVRMRRSGQMDSMALVMADDGALVASDAV